jgi:hypothetical protein
VTLEREDRLVHLWAIASGHELARWQADEAGALYSGGQHGTLKLWNRPFIRQELKKLGLDW